MRSALYAGDLDARSTNILMRSVYEWMTIGLLVSGLSAFMVTHSQALIQLLFGNPYMIWVLLLIELGLVVAISAGMNKMQVSTARVLFILFSVVDGMTLAAILLAFTEASIVTTFFVAAATFGVMSLYGYFTDKDLSSWGHLLFAALIGIIIAIVVNFFLGSPMLEWWISVIGVIVFVGLTAYDTQKIKEMGEALAGDDPRALNRVAIVGALALYLDLINLFLMFLEFFGQSRNR